MAISSRSPFTILAVWLCATAALGLLVQCVAWVLGLEFDILSQSGGGRGVLTGLAVGTLLVLMAAERRPAGDFGLAIDERWLRHLIGGFVLGVGTYAGYYLVAVLAGALSPREGLSAYRWFSASLSGLAAFGVALVQEAIFRGYLLSVFRRHYGSIVAVGVTGCLFAVLHRVDDPLSMFHVAELPLFAGMVLIGLLLGVVRLYFGNILFAASLLSGWIYVEIVVRKTKFLRTIADPTAAAWLCPQADPRRGVVMWGALAAAACVFVWLTYRDYRRAAGSTASPVKRPARDVSTSFKKVFPVSTMSMFAPLDLWLAQLWRARGAVGWKYVPRLAAVLAFSTLNSLLALPERLLAALLLRGRAVPDPVFIVGVHRSGTTHLQNLLAQDRRFVTPRTYQVMNPAGFLFSGWLVTPLLAAFSPWKRPMDGVRFHLFSPNEEEFALCNSSRVSPYWGMSFPRMGAYFDRYIFPERYSPAELRAWKRHYLLFLQKLTLWRRRRPLLKNPHNTARVAALRAMFPGARFIHIHRHPHAVCQSNRHLEREGHCLLQLQDPEESSSYTARFPATYRAMEDAFYRDIRNVPPEQVAELRFEDLERDPIGQLRRVYGQLGLGFDAAFQQRLEQYLASVAGYVKNRFSPVDAVLRRALDEELGPLMERWGYEAEPTAADCGEDDAERVKRAAHGALAGAST